MDYHSAPHHSSRVIGAVPQTRQRSVVASVHLPPEAIHVGSDGVTYFGIDVSPHGGWASWRIFKRYTDFFNLHSYLQGLGPSCAFPFLDAPFPRKHLTECQGQKLEARRSGLEKWLQSSLRGNFASWAEPLRIFLRCNQRERNTASSYAAPVEHHRALQSATAPRRATTSILQPASSLPSAPGVYLACHDANPGLSSVGDSCSPQDSGQEVRIQVPAIASPGQVILVTMPDGVDLTLRLPEQMGLCSFLNLRYDPLRRSVTVLNAVQRSATTDNL